MDGNNYTARSGQTALGGVNDALAEIGSNPVSTALRNVRSGYGDVQDVALYGVKLTLSEIGMARSLAAHGVPSNPGSISEVLQYLRQPGVPEEGEIVNVNAASSPGFDRYDSGKDFYFRCGDYYMPLSIRFTLRAQKNLVESQLIDGPTIIERVSKAPKTVDVTIRLERKPDENPTSLHVVNEENRYNSVRDISAMIRDLYETRDVFTVENPILNAELGVTHVVMREFTVIPGEGTTLMTVQMALTEIDITANIIDNEANENGSGEILTGQTPLA